jgi:hypothetical protein
MRLIHAVLITLAVWYLGNAASADDGSKAPPVRIAVQVRLMDGSIVHATLPSASLTVQTRYGKLSVPFAEIQRIEFGLHVPAEIEKSIATAINDLSAASFKEREEACKAILFHGPYAYPSVLRACKSADLETATRAQSCARKIEAAHSRLVAKETDAIVTEHFQITGRILDAEMKAASVHLGDLTLRISDLTAMSVSGASGGDLSVDAAKDWQATEIRLDSRQMLLISATGQVDLWPQAPGQFMATPKGYTTTGKGGVFMAGALIGKIGEGGTPFVIGDRYEGTPGEGKLFLSIVPSPWNNASVGKYAIKTRIEYR